MPEGHWLKNWSDYTTLDPEWVAKCLDGINRYGNRSPFRWSVARHSVLVAEMLTKNGLPISAALHGLCHDVHELWTGDVQRPIVERIRITLEDEQNRIDRHILPLLGVLPISDHQRGIVKWADNSAAQLEIDVLGTAYRMFQPYRAFDVSKSGEQLWLDFYVDLTVAAV